MRVKHMHIINTLQTKLAVAFLANAIIGCKPMHCMLGDKSNDMQCKICVVPSMSDDNIVFLDCELRYVGNKSTNLLVSPLCDAEDVRIEVSKGDKSWMFEADKNMFENRTTQEMLKGQLWTIFKNGGVGRKIQIGKWLAYDDVAFDFIARTSGGKIYRPSSMFFDGPGVYSIKMIYKAKDRGVGNWSGTVISKPVLITLPVQKSSADQKSDISP